ncbi:MAG: regulatory protein RecX [Cyclobacteriaceae bacterium]
MTESEKARIKKCKVKMARFCAYRERTHQEVKTKAYELGLRSEEADELLAELIAENFVSEERFAKIFVRDKFHLNKWGRRKIIQELQRRKISNQCINTGLQEIEEEDYLMMIEKLYAKKSATIRDDSELMKNQKAAAYLIRKGFESDLVWSLINRR